MHVDLVVARQPQLEDLQVQLAHAGDDRLAGLLVVVRLERRVLAAEVGQGLAQLVLVGGRLGLDRHADDRLGERRLLEDDRVVQVAERVAGHRLVDADARRRCRRPRRRRAGCGRRRDIWNMRLMFSLLPLFALSTRRALLELAASRRGRRSACRTCRRRS